MLCNDILSEYCIDGENAIFPKIEFLIFDVDLVGLSMKGTMSFYCIESPTGFSDDWCYINPIFYLGGKILKDISFKVKTY